ncbi:MAG TPA: tyrosinase family protein, partial [Allosphingosinicella sp.]|nr:tyrosinase family protein [Allosphingosinicella sp.]
MTVENREDGGLSRREFVVAGAALAGAAMVPFGAASAQAGVRYTRYNVADPKGRAMLDGYAKAIEHMLGLDADHPHNWYRTAFTHFLDCPHGNWWFLPWHRGFMGYTEQIVRQYSGMDDFAFPYWDWTQSPEVPEAMYDGVLDPGNKAYIQSMSNFRNRFEPMLENSGYWIKDPKIDDGGPDTTFGQLLARSVRMPDDAWFDMLKNPNTIAFFPNPLYPNANARGLQRSNRGLDTPTRRSVSAPTLLNALSPRDFVTFASDRTMFHANISGFGVLEGQPHNKVHNNVGGVIYDDATKQTNNIGGFLQNNLSPVDPLFFLHHSNMDRIWDVWTRKQVASGYPILPDGAPAQPGGTPVAGSPYAQWAKERFLFFIGPDGKPVTDSVAGKYASKAFFDYGYQPGSGEEFVPTPQKMLGIAPRRRAIQRVRSAPPAETARDLGVAVTLPAAFARGGRGPAAPVLFAKVTLVLPPDSHGELFDILVHAGDPSKARLVESVSLFGGHGASHGPVTFTVALTGVLAELDGVRADRPIYFQAVREGGMHGRAGHGVEKV